MKAKGFVALLILGILLVSAVACGEGQAGPVEEIADAAVVAYAGLDTYYQFDMDVTMEMDITTADEIVEGTVTVDMNGASDKVNGRTYLNMQVSADLPQATEMGVERYIIDDYMYVKIDVPGEPPTWMKWEICLQCGGGEKLDPVGQQVDLLKDSVDVELIGTEMVDATECYVLEVSPGLEKLWQWAQEQQGIGERLPDLESDLEQVISDFSINQWIAKDTYFTLKSTLDMTLTFSLGESSSPFPNCPACGPKLSFPGDFAMTFDITATVVVYDIEEPFTIELPPEAEDAEEGHISLPSFGLY